MTKLKKVLMYLILALVLFTPLIISFTTGELFEFPKMIFVYLAGGLIIYIYFLFTVFSGERQLKVGMPVYLYLLSFIVSTLFSTDLYTSVWGYYSRFNGGLISLLIYFGLFVVTRSIFDKRTKYFIHKAVIASAIPVSVYGVFQHFSIFEDFWKINSSVRVFSSFGQPNWLALYLIMIMPLIWWQFLSNEKRKYIWLIVYILAFSCFWFTYSLSGLLGFVVAAVIFGYKNFKLIKENRNYFLSIIFFSVVIAGTNLGLFSNKVHDAYLDIQKFITITHTAYAQNSDGYNVSDSGYIRKGMWEGSLSLATKDAKTLIIGTGPETFPYQYQMFRPTYINYSSEWDFILNKPHNYYLQIFTETGLLGVIMYGGLIAFYLKKANGTYLPILGGFLTAILFGWPTIASSVLFWVILALIDITNYEVS